MGLKRTVGFVQKSSQWRISIMEHWQFHYIVYTHYFGCTDAVYVDVQWPGNTSIPMTISCKVMDSPRWKLAQKILYMCSYISKNLKKGIYIKSGSNVKGRINKSRPISWSKAYHVWYQSMGNPMRFPNSWPPVRKCRRYGQFCTMHP